MAQKDHCQPVPCFPPQEPQAFGSHPPGPVDSVSPFAGLRAWCLGFLSEIWAPFLQGETLLWGFLSVLPVCMFPTAHQPWWRPDEAEVTAVSLRCGGSGTGAPGQGPACWDQAGLPAFIEGAQV